MNHTEIIEDLKRGMTEYGAARLLTGQEVSFGSTKLIPHSIRIVNGEWQVITPYTVLTLPQEVVEGIVGTIIREALGEGDNAKEVLKRAEALGRKVFGGTLGCG